MLPDNGKYYSHDYDYHAENEEVAAFFSHWRKRCRRIFFMLGAVTWGRGLRLSEALAMNVIHDFPLWQEGDFTIFKYREAKTNKIRENEIMPWPIAEEIKNYVIANPLILTQYEGYLFPSTSGRWKGMPVMSPEALAAQMDKWRMQIAREYNMPRLLEKYSHISFKCQCGWGFHSKAHREAPLQGRCPKCGRAIEKHMHYVHRVGWHSLRRNFEDNGLEYSGDNALFIQQMMHYSKLDVVIHYASKRRQRERIKDFLNNFISIKFNEFKKFDAAQRTLLEI